MDIKNEIVLYQPDELTKLEVHVEEETVWLSQQQMAQLFNTTKQNISLHINNIFKEGELQRDMVVKDFLTTTEHGAIKGKIQTHIVAYYNLDTIISVGYRVKSIAGTRFRQWANSVLKDYMLRGYVINQRLQALEERVAEHDKKIDFFVRTSLPPMEGVFYDGQIFDAYVFVSNLIKSATTSIILIDNYIDESVFTLLDKRAQGVQAVVYTQAINKVTQLDLGKHNAQYHPIEVKQSQNIHDRFLIIDEVVYHIGASIKDLGKKLFAFSKMELPANEILKKM